MDIQDVVIEISSSFLYWYWFLGPFFQFSFWKKGKNIAMQTTKSNFKFRTYSQCLNEQQQQQINIRSTDNCHINTNNNLHTHTHMKNIWNALFFAFQLWMDFRDTSYFFSSFFFVQKQGKVRFSIQQPGFFFCWKKIKFKSN